MYTKLINPGVGRLAEVLKGFIFEKFDYHDLHLLQLYLKPALGKGYEGTN